MLKTYRRRAAMAAALLALATPGALASVVLTGTRVVYPESEREVTLKVTNEGDTPSLVQAWIDDGDPGALPEEAKSPFTLTPPLFRLDPKKGQTLRIIHLQQPVPRDRESLFWLNVLDIPPVASGTAAPRNSLQFAFRTRIKLLFRPAGLPGYAAGAPAQVTWRLMRNDDGRQVLTATNPTPYHITYRTVEATAQGHVYRHDAAVMAEPGATIQFPIDGPPAATGQPDAVRYTFIDDFGASVTGVHTSRPAAPAAPAQ